MSDIIEELSGRYSQDELSVTILREAAGVWSAKAHDSFQLYQVALRNGDGATAAQHYNRAKIFRNNMKEVNEVAAGVAFHENNKHRTDDVIDLHHLFVREAITSLTNHINTVRSSKNLSKLTVIVGRGHHSKNGPKLNGAVADFASKNNIPYDVDPKNPGRMLLWIANVSEIQHENHAGAKHSESSVYKYNRANMAKLSDYMVQIQHKKPRTKKNRKPKQQADDRMRVVAPQGKAIQKAKQKTAARNVADCPCTTPTHDATDALQDQLEHEPIDANEVMPDEISLSETAPTEFTSNMQRTENVEPKAKKGKTNRSIKVASSRKSRQIQRRDSTHISSNTFCFASNRFRRFISFLLYALIGVIILAGPIIF